MRVPAVITVAAALALLSAGCVERRMLIRSVPSGAPVWVDEESAGTTPLDHPFSHYGVRGIRVGPIRNEQDIRTHREMERVMEVKAPWYETWPIDFVAEVLWPATLVDHHSVPVFVLPVVGAESEEEIQRRVEQLKADSDAFRESALGAIPESAP